MKNSKILIIIPAYNEEKCILKTCKSIMDYNKKNKTKYDIIVINDGSTDNTEKILVDNKIPHVRLIHNLGIGGAVQTGYKYAKENGYDIAIQFDGDGQHDVSYIKDLVNPIINKNKNMVIGSRFIDNKSSKFKSSSARRFGIRNICIGSRYIDKTTSKFKSTFMRRVGKNIISFMLKMCIRKKITDPTSGFRAVDKNIIYIFSDKYPVEYPEPITTVNVLLDGYNVEEVPVSMNERETGKSSINSWKNVYYMINVILSILIMKRGK